MTHTRTFTYEERALELALAASDPDLREKEQGRAISELAEWVQEMPEESRARVLAAAEHLVAATS